MGIAFSSRQSSLRFSTCKQAERQDLNHHPWAGGAAAGDSNRKRKSSCDEKSGKVFFFNALLHKTPFQKLAPTKSNLKTSAKTKETKNQGLRTAKRVCIFWYQERSLSNPNSSPTAKGEEEQEEHVR